MTLILELTPEQEQRLHDEAAREGLNTQEYALRRLLGDAPEASDFEPEVSESRARQIAAARAGFGKFAHVKGVSSYDFIARKQEEKAREERH